MSKALEAAARAAGFNNAEEMILFERQRSQKRAPQTISAKGAKKVADEKAKPKGQPRTLRDVLNSVSAALGGK